MTWAKLSDNFHSHPKTERMGLDGAGLYAIGISYAACHLTDGFLPKPWVKKQAPAKLVNRLVSIGAWLEVDGGYEIADFLDYNPPRAEIEEKRRLQRERQTRHRARTNGDVTRDVIGPDPTRTRPVLPTVDEEISNGSLDVGRFVEELDDADAETEAVLAAYSKRLPEAAFHTALESLNGRRARQPVLVSETRYFVATLNSMIREEQYA